MIMMKRSLQASKAYLKHFPGRTLPALPARCLAEAFDIGATTKFSMSEIQPQENLGKMYK